MSPKIRYEIEFPINSSPQLLYQYISHINHAFHNVIESVWIVNNI